LERLGVKHGTDYSAMAKDLKLNFNQLTATRLQKRLQRLARLEAERGAAGEAAEEEEESGEEESGEEESGEDEA
jgi:hypothetical protein